MRNRRLLALQTSLLAHLTDPRAFAAGPPLDPDLRGLDARRLALVGAMSLSKRRAKIARALPRTTALLGKSFETIVAEFASAVPPCSARRLVNAREFRDYLGAHWRGRPACLPDVAAIEVAIAEVEDLTPDSRVDFRPGRWLRRHPGLRLFRCRHDVRPILAGKSARGAKRRPVIVAVAPGLPGHSARIAEIAPMADEFLASIADWTSEHDVLDRLDGETIADLAEAGLIEVAP